ncbi:isoleucine--tRNA ligase [Christensenella minuta]|uniref:isoleucine--tRNA ligase n=1 Tax=Christensenella minuta TaxID=626937 RepID=UPI002A82F3F3|nr:isoleucine--tRNA ligase [Christensenella minuta]MDY3751017.1 isoleucine--tRNA ligase [Christensenella minuta]
MYKKVLTDLKFGERELEVLDFWHENKIFEQSMKENEDGPKFTFYDGPPTANGKPHIGHILTRCIKDLIPRYKTMQGYNVLRKAGWDTHGLPVELEVEKLLGLDGKEQIEEYGVEPFIQKCKESVWKYKGEWEKMSDRVGYWADMDDPYVTYENDYIESVWWSLKEIHKKGLLYKGHKIVPYCPRCGTALSSHEVAQGYKDVKETSIFVRFKVKGEDAYFLAWTTTPWTLPSNVALCVNPNEEYVLAQDKNGDQYYLAKALCEKLLGEDAHIVRKFTGKELEFKEYEPLFDFVHPDQKAWYITCDTYVTLTDGSGIVHIAPAFGEDDANVGRKYGLPFVQLVKPDGTMSGETKWPGVFVKKADKLIIEDLRECGLLFAEVPYEHSYPFCWRCDTPLIYYARSTWFIKMTELRDNLLKNNASVNWLPENIKNGRMGNFLENVIDWGISRERYWGTPLPVWTCGCGHVHVVGSRSELREMAETDVPEDIELHKPFLDPITLKCPECGGSMHRVPEVIDCWYDSGSMPFAQWHYPFEHKEEFESHFPANFISEAVDQTRGWFYTLLAIGTLIFDKAPFENCIVLGHVQDKDGQKMSKHKGNVVDPWSVLDKQGADAVRWYFYSASAPWLPSRFYDEAVSEMQRKFMGTLWNTYAFYILYVDIDGFDPTKYELKPTNIMDKWVLSRLHSLVRSVTDDLDHYRIIEPSRSLSQFVDELSNWYVRRSRDRFWGSGMEQDKIDAYMTLYTVLETLTRLLAPFTPFMTESIYQNLVRTNGKNAPLSVHLTKWPQADEALIDTKLERDMDAVLNVVNLGRACRNTANIKNRQPIAKIFVSGIDHLDETFLSVIRGELNAKEVELGAAAAEYITYNVKPQMRTLGPKYGKLLGGIRAHLAQADGMLVVSTVRGGAAYEFEVDGSKVSLQEEDVLVEPAQREGFVAETSGDFAVIIDTTLTPELIEEGNVREIISKVQTMRKEAGFEVTDKIELYAKGNDKITAVMENNEDRILSEVLAQGVQYGVAEGYEKEWNINGEKVTLGVKKA